MPAEPAELWAFYLAAATVAVILVVTAGAAVIVAQRKITAATRDYAARQVAALEEERGRVARELHDDVSQQIAVLSHRLDAIQEALRPQANEPALLLATESVRGGLRSLAESVRVLAHRMHPSALDHLGLGPALKDLAREAAMGTSHQIIVDVASEAPEPDPLHALALYRVAQEALRNVRKHSGAKQALLRVVQSEADTTLIVWDDGVGFVAESASRSDGLGMVSMRERLRLVGGELSISSVPGEGTTVCARVPRGIGADG
jgi:signal transduction histidine kinase